MAAGAPTSRLYAPAVLLLLLLLLLLPGMRTTTSPSALNTSPALQGNMFYNIHDSSADITWF
jgi:hypothetical protein